MIQEAMAAMIQPLQAQLQGLQAEFQAIRNPEEMLMDEVEGMDDTSARPTKIARAAFPQSLSGRGKGGKGALTM